MTSVDENSVKGRLERHELRTGREAVMVQGKGDASPVLVEKKAVMVEEFAFLFYRNMRKVLMGNKLSQMDILVLFSLLERQGIKGPVGLVGVSQAGMAKELGISRQQVHKSCGRLESAGVLVRDENDDICINPAVILKGSPRELYNSRQHVLEQGMKAIGVNSVV